MLLFIAPVSAFNQTLTEDRSVNRLVRVAFLASRRASFIIGFDWESTVGLVPVVEVVVPAQALEKSDICVAAQQIRPPGCEAPVWNPISTVCDVLQRSTKQNGERPAV
jgi:hypothetical protein